MKKIKLLLLCTLALFIFSSCSKTLDKKEEKLSQLNSKYRLVSAEPLGDTNKYSSLVYSFDQNLYQANILDAFKPEKELILKFKSDVKTSALDDVFLLKLRTNEDTQEIAKQYQSIDFVLYAEANFEVELSAYNEFAPKANVDMSEESKDATDSNIIVAVIDSGVDINHKDLKDRIVSGYNFISDDKDVMDDYGHGTHVAGIIASNSSAKIMPIKFTDGKKGKISDLAKAIKFAVDNDADIINLSLGLNEKSSLLMDSVDFAIKNEIPVVAAAGNYNTSKKYYPAAYNEVIAVTGLANDGTKLPQSNFGTWVDYSAKAQDVLSTTLGDNYGYATGTSQAAPFISAGVANILGNKKDANLKFIISSLNKISTPAGTGKLTNLLGRTIE